MTLNMRKGADNDIAFITTLRAGVAWKPSGGGRKGLLGRIKRHQGADLDIVCVAITDDARPVRMAWFDNVDAFDDGSLIHTGDNTSGRGDGDDETIVAHLTVLPPEIQSLVFIVAAYKDGVTFADVEGVTLNVYDDSVGSGSKVGSFMPSINATRNACVMARARFDDGVWTLTVINELDTATNRDQLLGLALRHGA